MPLPAATERAAAQVERRLDEFDAATVEYIAAGGNQPSARAALDDCTTLILAATAAALREVDPDVTDREIRTAAADQIAAVRAALRASTSSARRARRRATRRAVQDDGEPDATFARRVGAFAALAVIAARMSKRQRARDLRKIARRVQATLPRPTAAYARMVVRTESAIARNKRGADVADRDDLVILVLDARKGPTDEACERVNGRYATPTWIRRNPVEHPNCTRLGRPVKLPKGARVTLLE